MPKNKPVYVSDILGAGWKTPDTYCNDFAVIGDFSAVYAIVLFDDDWLFKSGLRFKIAYIGMSKRLSRRFANHHALRMVKETERYYQTWFKHVHPDALRVEERNLIRKYDPPLNLIGKKVSLA